ncbi:MAG TPA: hypothetical protein VGV18_04480 [Verrucomicrobiae bacterium]|nr:hypothetical protein [Verrucomicrobiae bacterium]
MAAWISSEEMPTLKQAEAFAKTTHTPIGYLFLPTPPVEKIPIPDFRAMDHQRLAHPSPDLLDTIYICQQRQDWYRDYARSIGDTPLPFVGSADVHDDIIATATRIAVASVPMATVGSPRSNRQSVSRLTKRRAAMSLVEMPRLRRASASSRPNLRSAWAAGSGSEVVFDIANNVCYVKR